MPDSLHTCTAAGDSFLSPVCQADTQACPANVLTESLFSIGRPVDAVAADTAVVPCLQLEEIYMPAAEGVPGIPLSYMPGTDDGFGIVLLLTLFFTIGAAVRSWHGLCASLGNLFRPSAGAGGRDVAGTSEMHGRFFFVLQAALMLGLLYFCYFSECLADGFGEISPRRLLAADVAVCLVFCYLKLAVCRLVNAVFFSRSQALLWTDACHLFLFAIGFLLLPVTLLTVYSDLPLHVRNTVLLTVFTIMGILLFFRCFSIFFKHGLGYVHLILYFCALEIVPAFMLWRFLLRINLILTTTF